VSNLILQDLRHALRALLKHPGYLITALVTLALGIGFSTATFSVIHAVLIRPLPFAEPDRLVQLRERNLPRFPQFSVSPAHYLFWRENNTTFEAIAAVATQSANLDLGDDDPQRVRADRVSVNLFSVLGVEPLWGRTFQAADEQGTVPRVVVLSHGAWQRRFGGARDIIGRTIRLDRNPVTVVGVMPEGYRYPSPDVEMWVPMIVDDTTRRSFGNHHLVAIGRLKAGVTFEGASEDMARVSIRLAEHNPGSAGWEVLLFGLQDFTVRNVKDSLLVLLGAVSLVLLIACANVANLLLARGAARQKELAIRSSIGATRARLLRQLLVEQLTLALVSAGAGVLMAAWLLRVLLAMVPDALPPHADVRLDGTVLAFAIALAIATPLLFGLLPALQGSRPDLRTLMSAGGRSGSGVPSQRTRTILVVAEIALAMTLLVGAGLLIRSFARLAGESPGFEPSGALVAGVSLPESTYPEGEAREGFTTRFLERLRALPGLQAAGLSMPMAMVGEYSSGYEIEGEPPAEGGRLITLFYAVSPGFFDVMKTPLIRGRYISEADRLGSTRVILINDFLAERHFAGVDPVGRRMRVQQGYNSSDWREIVGVVGNTKHDGLGDRTRAQVYEPYLQHPYFSAFNLVVRATTSDPTAVVPQIRSVLRELDPELPLARVRTLEEIVDTTVRQQRFSTTLIGTFGGAALLLSAVGLYGVIAYTVGLRRQEFAIRIAHGAGRRDILRLVLQGAAVMASAGIVLGLGAAWLLRGVLASLLFNISPSDPMTYLSVAAVLMLTTILASAVPAIRATRVDPIEALRE
jgi:putative ABC transport system permease protein